VTPYLVTLQQRLVADPDVYAFVNNRVFPVQRGQTAPLNVLPAITYSQVDDVPEKSMGYGPSFGPARAQYTCWSKYQTEAHRLAWRVRRALRGFTDPTTGIDRVIFDSMGSDDKDPAADIFTVPVDFMVWLNEQTS
jgi:hypothetical protein